ncbi:transcriptional regulator GcvA [Benzoatithermus flavus]|uniref:Transcriptional regulator GcvA n=1 Tax=Benzoatithermus flavus TaxID=3108223 RepID=A0ABU8XN56_9PROT
MRRHLPPLAAVRAFEAAARLGSFTKAGEELGATQAAISYQIKLLEERVGTPLFLRLPRQVVPTEAGRRLAAAVSEAFDLLQAAFASFRQETESVLAISSVPSFAVRWLAPRLGAFQLAHPSLAVRLTTANRLVDFAREEVDAAIRSGRGDWPGLEAHPLLRVTFTPMCSPDFLQRTGSVDSPAALLRLPLLSPTDRWWRRWFALAGVEAPVLDGRGAIGLDSQPLEGSAALAGQGVAMLTPELWRDELRAGRLVQLFDLVGDEGHHYWLVYPKVLRRLPKIRALRDWLLVEAERYAAELSGAMASAPPKE